MTVKGNSIAKLFRQYESDVLVTFLEIKTDTKLYLCNYESDINKSLEDGSTQDFVAFPFKVILPNVVTGEEQGDFTLKIKFDNTDLLITEYIRGIRDPVKVTVHYAFASSPNANQLSFTDIELYQSVYTTKEVNTTLFVSRFFKTAIPPYRYNKREFPGANL